MSNEQAGDARAIYASLWRRRRLIVAIALAVMVVAFAVDLVRSPSYSASVQVIIQPPSAAGDAGSGSTDPATIETELQVLASSSVRRRAADELGLEEGSEPSVGVARIGESQVAQISTTAGSAERAAEVANAYADAYVAMRRDDQSARLEVAMTEVQAEIDEFTVELSDLNAPIDAFDERIAAASGNSEQEAFLLRQKQQAADQIEPQKNALVADRSEAQRELSGLKRARRTTDQGAAQVISPARVPVAPVSPKPLRDLIAAGVLGIGLGAAVVLLLERLDDTVRDVDSLASLTGLPVLGTVPKLSRAQQRGVVSMTEPRSPASEAYRTLRTSVQFMEVGTPLQVLHVSSPEQGDGKSLAVSNLAVATARAGRRTILIDCDLRRPAMHERFGLPGRPGLSSVLLGEAHLEDVLQPVPGVAELYVVTAGAIAPNPAELLASPAAEAMLARLREIADVVLIDGPPLLPVTDGQVLARLADASLLVVTAGRSKITRVRRALDLLRRVDATVIGTLINQVADEAASTSYLHYDDAAASFEDGAPVASPMPRADAGPAEEPPPEVSSANGGRRSRHGTSGSAKGVKSSAKGAKARPAVPTVTIDGDRDAGDAGTRR